MSYDLELFTTRALSPEIIERVAADLGLKVHQSADGEEWEVYAQDSTVPEFLLQCEEEFERPVIKGYSLEKCNSVVSGSASGSSNIDLLHRYFRQVASLVGGELFDPQVGALIFPKRRSELKPSLVTFDLLNVVWKFPMITQLDQFDHMLQVLAAHLPWAYPTNYGRTYSNRFVVGEERKLFEFFDVDRTLSWHGSGLPLIFVYLSADSTSSGKDQSDSISTLQLYLDATDLLNKADFSDEFVEQFAEVSEALRSLHAFAFIEQNRHREGCREVSTGSGEVFSVGHTTVWRGIADIRAWLSWYGDRSLPLVAPSLKSEHHLEKGHLLRLGRLPQNHTQLEGLFPELAEEVKDPNSGNVRV